MVVLFLIVVEATARLWRCNSCVGLYIEPQVLGQEFEHLRAQLRSSELEASHTYKSQRSATNTPTDLTQHD